MSVTGLALSLLIAIVSISLCFLWKKVNQSDVSVRKNGNTALR